MKMKIFFPTSLLLLTVSCATSPSGTKENSSEMVDIQGGIVKVGGYEKDQAKWGEREAFINSFSVDVEPRSVNFSANRDCFAKKGRLPEEAELYFAFKSEKLPPAKNFELTQSDINYAGTKGGQYNVRILGTQELRIVKPSKEDINSDLRRRCIIPKSSDFDQKSYTLKTDVHPYKGRGKNWGELPLLRKGTAVSLFYRDHKWALVDLEADGPDSGGWVPAEVVEVRGQAEVSQKRDSLRTDAS